MSLSIIVIQFSHFTGISDGTIFAKNGPFPENDVYFLEQFHAHWGRSSLQGSEHLVDGHAYSGELHMVFWNTRYGNFKEAMNKKGGLAVLAVFLEEGETKQNELHEVIKGYQIEN